MRQEGMGKAVLEPQIMEEIEYFTEYFISPNTGKPISVANSLQLASCNIVLQMFFGSRLHYNDQSLKEVVDNVACLFALVAKLNLLTSIPIIGKLSKPLQDKCTAALEGIRSFANQNATRHKETLDPNHPRDALDRYLLQSQTVTSEEDKICFSGK